MRPLHTLALSVALCGMGVVTAATDAPLVVLAATSLTDALRTAGAAYESKTGRAVSFTFEGSSTLASRMEAGASADVFLPADANSMDYVEKRHLIDPKSRRNLLGNRLVLIASADSAIQLKIVPRFALSGALGKGRLAIVDPDAVAVGRYARYALISLGLWNSVSDRIVKVPSISAAMTSVKRGEATLGIVYETDVRGETGVRVVDVFPASAHPRIVYPVALTSNARAGADRFVEFLSSPEARKIFARYGFRAE